MKPICVLLITLLFGLPSRRYLTQGTILLKALGRGISVLWTHFFSSYLFVSLLFPGNENVPNFRSLLLICAVKYSPSTNLYLLYSRQSASQISQPFIPQEMNFTLLSSSHASLNFSSLSANHATNSEPYKSASQSCPSHKSASWLCLIQ